ncbi:MAG: RNA polymerase sigma factor [Chlamydiota bacterium]
MNDITKTHPVPPDDPEEARVLDSCARGEWEEFRYLFDKYRDRVYFLALSIVKDSALARDVTQASFIKVFKSLKWFDRRARFSTWLYRITYHQALDHYRRRRTRDEIPLTHAPGEGEIATSRGELFNSIAGKEFNEKIRAAVDALPVKLRTAVVLKYFEGCTFSEICEIVGCARGVLQKRLSQASAKLRDALGREISLSG